MAARINLVGGGKGQDKLFSDALRRAAKRRDQGDVQAIERLADVVFDKALGGDMTAAKEIGDRLEGKAHQSTALTGPDGTGPAKLIVELIDATKREP